MGDIYCELCVLVFPRFSVSFLCLFVSLFFFSLSVFSRSVHLVEERLGDAMAVRGVDDDEGGVVHGARGGHRLRGERREDLGKKRERGIG